MGLDMYLYRKTYAGNQYRKPEEQVKVSGKGIRQERVSEVTEQVGYWRKANQIHGWFVENVCHGNDDCQPHYVSREQLEALLALVRKVLAATTLVPGRLHAGTEIRNGKTTELYEDGKVVADAAVAQELLPAHSGFFFGGTEYDQWYVADLESTEKILVDALAEPYTADFYYEASW